MKIFKIKINLTIKTTKIKIINHWFISFINYRINVYITYLDINIRKNHY